MGTLMEFQCFQFQLSASIQIHIRNREKNIIQIVPDQKKSEKKCRHDQVPSSHQSANRSLQLREKSPDSRVYCAATQYFFVAIFWFLP